MAQAVEAGGDVTVTRGTFAGRKGELLILALPGSEYQVYLAADASVTGDATGRLKGRVLARARRVDVVTSGGRFVEPVYGRPRRVQGVVVATDTTKNTITVRAALPITVELTDLRQKASQFTPGQFVGFDIERGARFEPVA